MYIGRQRLHRHWGHHPLGSGLWFAGILRFVGQTMLLFFLLIYFFGLGFSPVAVLSYGLAFNLFSLVLNHWVIGRVISSIGPHRMIALSNIGLILFAFGLYNLPVDLVFLYALAALQALSFESYYLSQHVYLAATTAKADTGKKVARQFSTEPIGVLLGPLIAGLVAWLWSAQAVSFVAGIILVAGGVLAFVFHDKSVDSRHHYSYSKIWQIYRQMIKKWRNPLMIGGVISFDFVSQITVLYIGVFVLAAVESSSGYGVMGLFSFFGSIFGIWVAAWVGRQADKGSERKLLKQSFIGEVFAGLCRIALSLPSRLANLIALGTVSFLGWLPWESRSISVYRRAYKLSDEFGGSGVEYAVCLENFGTLCRVVLFGLACLLSLVVEFKTTLILCFSMGFVINFIFLIRPSSSEAAQ